LIAGGLFDGPTHAYIRIMQSTDPMPDLSPETRCAPAPDRALLRVSGPDHVKFLQGLVTQDMARLASAGIAYGALLTPQGKLVADFFLVTDSAEAVLIDVAEGLADDLQRRLTLFTLRAQVTISRDPRPVTRGLGPAPAGALADPRDPALGWRLYGQALTAGAPVDWDALRIAARVPETGLELQPGDSFILELGFERLHGVDFRKGCYVGQEVTARMHHKTELRRGLKRVTVAAPVAPGTPILAPDGREAGTLHSLSGYQGLALLRLDRISGALSAAGHAVTVLPD